jgi:hypothetical protein
MEYFQIILTHFRKSKKKKPQSANFLLTTIIKRRTITLFQRYISDIYVTVISSVSFTLHMPSGFPHKEHVYIVLVSRIRHSLNLLAD